MRMVLAQRAYLQAIALLLVVGGMLSAQRAQAQGPPDEDFAIWSVAHVKLAWLEDPATFRLNLGVRVNPDSLIVYGFVPTEAIRRRVLNTARETSKLPVVDALKLHFGQDPGLPRIGTAEELHQATLQMVGKVLGGNAKAVSVSIHNGDQVTLAGSVESLEEQLLLSLECRKLSGCVSVTNKLEVLPGVRAASTAAPRNVGVLAPVAAPDLTYWKPKLGTPVAAEPVSELPIDVAMIPQPQLATPVQPRLVGLAQPKPVIVVETEEPAQPVQAKAGGLSVPGVLYMDPVLPPVVAKTHGSFEREGIVLLDEPAPETPQPSRLALVANTTPPEPKATIPPASVKEKMIAVCDDLIRDVVFTLQASGELEVALKLRIGHNFAPLADRIKRMPEMAGRQIVFDVMFVP